MGISGVFVSIVSVLNELHCIFPQALFRASLPHPTSDRDYALYDVGEGCEVTNLVPGIDFLSDRFRCNGRSMVAALRWVTEELARGRHNLYVSVVRACSHSGHMQHRTSAHSCHMPCAMHHMPCNNEVTKFFAIA